MEDLSFSYAPCDLCSCEKGNVLFHDHLSKANQVSRIVALFKRQLAIHQDITVVFIKNFEDKKSNSNFNAEVSDVSIYFDEDNFETVEEQENPNSTETNITNTQTNLIGDEVSDNFDPLEVETVSELFEDENVDCNDNPKGDVEMNVKPSKAPVYCDQCSYQSISEAVLIDHKQSFHLTNFYKCSSCERQFPTSLQLNRHCRFVHKINAFYCQYCTFITNSPTNLEKHKHVDHNVEYPIENDFSFCHPCQQPVRGGFKHIENVHFKNSANIHRDYQCSTCKEILFVTYNGLNRHKQKCETGDTSFVCKTCNESFATLTKRQKHIIKVHKPRVVDLKGKKCHECDYATWKMQELEDHVRQCHVKECSCDECGQKFNTQFHLNNHILSFHQTINPSVCNECGRAFTSENALQDHLDLHKDIFKYNCAFCDSGLNNSGALHNHQLICSSNPDRFSSLKQAKIMREQLKTQ